MARIPSILWLTENFRRRRKHTAEWWKVYNGHEAYVNDMKCMTEYHMLGHAQDIDPTTLGNHISLWHGVALTHRSLTNAQMGKLHLRLHAEKAK